MEKPFDKKDALLKDLLKEAGTEPAPKPMKGNIMEAIKDREPVSQTYKPLIPVKMWITLLIVLVALVVVLILQPDSVSGPASFLDYQLPSLNLPTVKLPRAALYGIAFLGLFLLQLPFIKRLLEAKGPLD